MDIEKQKWQLPSEKDENAFMIRAIKAEEHLREALNLLHHVKESIPQYPASETKILIRNFLSRFYL